MTLPSIVDSGFDNISGANSANLSTVTHAYAFSAGSKWLFGVLAASYSPGWVSATADGEPMLLVANLEAGANARLIVFAIHIEASGIASAGNIVFTASSTASNRNLPAYFTVGVELATAPASSVETTGTFEPASQDSTTVAISAGSPKLFIVGGRLDGDTADLDTGTALINTVTSAAGTDVALSIYLVDSAFDGSATLDATAGDLSYVVISLDQVSPPYQGWPRGGFIYA